MASIPHPAPTPRQSRRVPRAAGVLVAAIVIVAGTYGVSQVRTLLAPTTPVRVPVTVAQVAAAPDVAPPAVPGEAANGATLAADASLATIDHNIGLWTKTLAANDRDYISATNLATLYHGRGRLTADLGDQQRALQAATTAIAIAPTYTPARDLQAAIQFTLHDFDGAFDTAQAVLRADPSDLGALATRFDAEIELGRIDDATADLSVLSAGTTGAPIDVRAARLLAVTGDPAGALVRAKAAETAASSGDDELTPTDRGFYAYAVGEYARVAGDAATARAAYREALDLRATDLASMVGLARIDAFEGDLDAAIDGLQRAAAIAPQPETLGLLADLLTQRGAPGDAALAATQTKTVRFIEQLGEIQAQVFDRQLLRFELDHGGATATVVDRARASLDARPDWTGHDTLAWALYRTGRLDDAASEIAAARALGADDARLRYHEGAIDLARGDAAGGMAMLRSALDLGPALDPVERAEATHLVGG